MHKKDMVDAMLGKIEQAIIRILNNSQSIDSYHYYLITPAGMERLESTCMLLMAVGEGIKGVDKMTNKNLLVHYPEIDWKGVMGMRDIIAHHYFDLDASWNALRWSMRRSCCVCMPIRLLMVFALSP